MEETKTFAVNLYQHETAKLTQTFETYIIEAKNRWHAFNKAAKLHRESGFDQPKQHDLMELNQKVRVAG